MVMLVAGVLGAVVGVIEVGLLVTGVVPVPDCRVGFRGGAGCGGVASLGGRPGGHSSRLMVGGGPRGIDGGGRVGQVGRRPLLVMSMVPITHRRERKGSALKDLKLGFINHNLAVMRPGL